MLAKMSNFLYYAPASTAWKVTMDYWHASRGYRQYFI